MSDVIRHDLGCGTPVFFEPMSGVRSVGLTWLVPAGTATDPAEVEGLSAMWWELIQRGAGDLGSREHTDALDRLGVSRSVSVEIMSKNSCWACSSQSTSSASKVVA